MPDPSAEPSAEQRLRLVKVARRFYVDEVSKVDIADELGISRYKVARLLDQAHALGIVTITVDDRGVLNEELSDQLREQFSLHAAVVVGSGGSDEEVRQQVGTAAADHLTHVLHRADVLGISWGRTVRAMTEALQALPPVDVVQLTGAAGKDFSQSPVEVVRRVSERAGGIARPILAPMVLRDASTAAALQREPEVREAIRMFSAVTVAVVAIGSWDPPISQLRDLIREDDRIALEREGVIAEIAGILLDDHGHQVGKDFADRCVSITADQLRAVPHVLAVAGGAGKARATLAVLRSGLISSLVTDDTLARRLLAIDEAGRP